MNINELIQYVVPIQEKGVFMAGTFLVQRNTLSGKALAGSFPLFMLVFFASTAAFAVWSGGFFLGITPKIEFVVSWWFIVFGVYGINRYTDVEDYLNDSMKRDFFLRNQKFLYLAIVFLAGSALWLLATGLLTMYHVLCIYAGVAYSVPLFPSVSKKFNLKWVRLKEIPFIKSLLVTVIMGTSFFALYMADKHVLANRLDIAALLIGSSLSMFINTVFCDVRDAVGDKAAGVRTIPVILGNRRTLTSCIIIPSLVWMTTVATLYFLSLLSAPVCLFLLLIAVYPALYISIYYSKKVSQKVVFLIADACVPLFAIGLVVIKLAMN